MTVAPIRPPSVERIRPEARAPSGPSDQPLSLAHLLGVLLQRKWLILGIAALVTGFMTLYVEQLVPIYSAEATVVVEPSRQRILSNVESVVQGLNTDYYTNETEAAVLGSREVARKVVESLSLVQNPEFNPTLRVSKKSLTSTLLEPVKTGVQILATKLGDLATGGSYSRERAAKAKAAAARRSAAQVSPEEERREALETATDIVLYGESIIPAQRARVITVRFQSSDPETAARIANAIADTYILQQLSAKESATTKASEFLSQRAEELRNRVIESQKKLEDFRRKSGIVEVGGASVYQRQRDDLETQLIQARAKRAEADARYDQIQKMLKSGGIDTAAAVLDSQLIQRLREQETQAVRKLAELKTKLRPNHPTMEAAQNDLKDLDKKIKDEVNKIVVSLANERDIAIVREKNLTEEIASLQSKIDAQHDAEVTLKALESEVNANNQLYETILARFKQADVQEAVTPEADAKVISRATVPNNPFYPRKKFIILASLVLSTLMGTGLAILLEFLDTGFRSLTQLESLVGVPSLGVVPYLRIRRGAKPAHQIAAEQPNSSFGEAIRTLRTAILLSNVDRPPRSVMITSALPSEGKTSTVLALGCLAARSGQKVAILDCDFRHPSVHESLGYENGPGLADYLAGRVQLKDILEIEPRYGLRFISAGSPVPNPPDLLSSSRMRDLIAELSGMFDLVLLDTPPLLVVSDSLVLARFVEKAAFVVRWSKTKRKNALLGLKQLLDAGADVAGALLTQVDVRRQSQYDTDGYYRYHHYYTS